MTVSYELTMKQEAIVTLWTILPQHSLEGFEKTIEMFDHGS
jgi:hypothetical protein